MLLQACKNNNAGRPIKSWYWIMKTKIQQEACLMKWLVHDVICPTIQSSKITTRKEERFQNLLQSVWKYFWSSLQTITNSLSCPHHHQQCQTRTPFLRGHPGDKMRQMCQSGTLILLYFSFCCTIVNPFNCLPARPIWAVWQVFMNPKLGKASKSKIRKKSTKMSLKNTPLVKYLNIHEL